LTPPPLVKGLGLVEYRRAWAAMQAMTEARGAQDADEIWLLEHPPVYTLGRAGRHEHLLAPAGIPVVQTDRGGQVTYHGPGQVVAYVLLDLGRLGLGVRQLVTSLEQAVIDLLGQGGVQAERRAGAPGVYVQEAKVAALGLRVRRGCCYHGLALNVAMDLSPFARIDPCGYPGLRVTQTSELGLTWDPAEAAQRLGRELRRRLFGRAAPPG
jgi:lipoyl(octanoyl) transferase